MRVPPYLIWLDLEMTGLDPHSDHILEIATVVTNFDLDIVAEGPVIAIYQDEETLKAMDGWNTRQHGQSGLMERVRTSRYSCHQAEQLTLEFLEQWVERKSSPLCGNSVGHDRRFMGWHMPRLEAYFHYRNLDVSTLKELARRWKPELIDKLRKRSSHQALDDIKESINELRFYRKYFIV